MADADLGNGRSCFVIGPIGSRLAPIGTDGRAKYENATQMWEHVFLPACETFGLQPVRADKIAEPGEIPDQIFTLLRDADVVIADLSGGNANVMYELGLRHTRDKITVQVGEYERLPFDVNTIRTIQFRRTEAGLIDARDALIDALRAALGGHSSPVTATRVWNEGGPVDPGAFAAVVAKSQEPDAVSDDDSAPGFVDVLAEGEAAIGRMTELMQEAVVLMEQFRTASNAATGEISKSDKSGGGFGGRLRVARELAARLSVPATAMDELSNEYVNQVSLLDAAIDYIIGRIEADPSELDDAVEYLQSLVDMANSAEEAGFGLTSVSHAARDMRKIAKDLIPVSKSIVLSMGRFLAGNDTIISWRERVIALPGWGSDGTA